MFTTTTASPRTTVIKRDGRAVPFDSARIERALRLCFDDLGITPGATISDLEDRANRVLHVKFGSTPPTVEQIQDVVEQVLLGAGEFAAAKHYILYREAHAQARAERPIDADTRAAFDDAAQYFPTPIQQFQFFDKYARWNSGQGRRETWVETVSRSIDWLYALTPRGALPADDWVRLQTAILKMEALPSMRLLALSHFLVATLFMTTSRRQCRRFSTPQCWRTTSLKRCADRTILNR